MIRYDKKLNAEIRRTVNNFNAKIRRLEKLEDDNIVLPEKVKVSDFKKGYDSRRDLRRRLNYLRMFSKRGAEQKVVTEGGYITSRYNITVTKRESTRVKRLLTRKINQYVNIESTIFGEPTGQTRGRMEDVKLTTLRAKRQALNKNLMSLNAEEYQRYQTYLDKQEASSYKDRIFKENYIDMLMQTGYLAGYDGRKIEEMSEQIMRLSPNEFVQLFDTEEAIKNILDNYYLLKMNNLDGAGLEDVFDDIGELYDNLFENLPQILKSYK